MSVKRQACRLGTAALLAALFFLPASCAWIRQAESRFRPSQESEVAPADSAAAESVAAAKASEEGNEEGTENGAGRSDTWTEIRNSYGLDGERCVVISKERMAMYVMEEDGTLLHAYDMACGKGIGDKVEENDMKTPEGKFLIQGVFDAKEWVHDFGDGRGLVRGAYGPYFVRLDTPPFEGIGIHGTHDPASIGSRATEGCIRLTNADISDFVRNYARVGMPVVILKDRPGGSV